jgi:hypothetical protein
MHENSKITYCRANGLAMTSRFRLAPLAAAVALYFAGTASAATIMVNNSTAASLPNSCTIVDAIASINQGSLVATSNCANSGSAFGTSDTITFSSNFAITFITPAGSASSALVLTKPVTITGNMDGSGKPLVAIQRSSVTGTPNFRLVQTNSDIAVTGLVLSNGFSAGGNGGGLSASASANVTLTNSVVSGNTGRFGGGVYSISGSITLTNSAIVGNTAQYSGGGVDSNNNSVTATGSTISGNAATNGRGGGIYAHMNSTAIDTTISGNMSTYGGGGIIALGNISLTFCTVSGNSAPFSKGGAGVHLGTFATIASTATMIFNNGPAADVDKAGSSAAVMTGAHNLIGTHGTLVTVPPDTNTCNPNLGPLFDNGGPTQTQPLFAGSCALAASPTSTTVLTDQRGLPRSIGGMTDIGAFEKQGPNDPPDLIFINGFDP